MDNVTKLSIKYMGYYQKKNGHTMPKMEYYNLIKELIHKNLVTDIDINRIYNNNKTLDDIYLYSKTYTETKDHSKANQTVQRAEDLSIYNIDENI